MKVPESKMALHKRVLGSNHRNRQKSIQKSSSSERLGLNALPDGTLTSLFKQRSQELGWPSPSRS